MGYYGLFKYGEDTYGIGGLPTSVPWDIFDFCEPTDATMLNLFSYSEVTSTRPFGAPYLQYNGSNDLCMYSNDELDSGFRMDVPVTDTFSIQFSILPTALPDDFSDRTKKRFFVGVYNRYAQMAGLLLSENGGIAIAQTGDAADIDVLPDSADLFDNGTTYYIFRVVVDAATQRTHIYVTPKDLVSSIGHQLRYTLSSIETPGSELDHVKVDVYGDASDPTTVCLDCIRLASTAVVPNQRPVAIIDDDKTEQLGSYAYFDGSASYDPEGQPLRYWWTLHDAPEVCPESWNSGTGTTAADASGYTNKLTAAAGTFTGVAQGDELWVGDYYSPVMWVADDGSAIAAIDHVFPAGVTDIEWKALIQDGWGGNLIASSLLVVQQSTGDPSLLTPAVGDAYRVTTGIGVWLNKDNQVATWNGTGWDYYGPSNGDVLYDIAANLSYRYHDLGSPAPPPYAGAWYEDEPHPWELQYWDGRTLANGTVLPTCRGLHIVHLIVNDGELNSLVAEALLNVYATDVPFGLIPDMSFVWNYLSDFWSLVEDREKAQRAWSGLTQVLASELMALWQHDYSKSLLDIQRTFQRRWVNFDPYFEEPSYDEDTIAATINNSLNVSGFSSTPNVLITDPVTGSPVDSPTAYDLGTTVANITDSHVLVLAGIAYRITRVETGATTIVTTLDVMPIGTDRAGGWMIRPTVKSTQTDFGTEGIQAGDKAIFEVVDGDDVSEVTGYVWGVRGDTLAFDDTDVSAHLSNPDKTVYFKAVLRRNAIAVDDLVVDIPRLQEVINTVDVEDAPTPLIENNDYIVEELTSARRQDYNAINFTNAWFPQVLFGYDGADVANDVWESASSDFVTEFGDGADLTGYVLETPQGTFRLYQVVSATRVQLVDDSLATGSTNQNWTIRRIDDPPDTMWAEVVYLDNRETIEANFGRLVSFTLDDLESRTDDLDYLSAVQGLWYAFWFGPTVHNIAVGSQIMLGLPFAEKAGTIISIVSPFDSTRDRMVVVDDDDAASFRTYYYPTAVGAHTDDSGTSLQVGDHVDQFDPLSNGVEVEDYISDPNWISTFVGSGDLTEVAKLHHFLVRVNAEVFDLTNLLFMQSFVLRVKPTWTYPYFVVLKELEDSVDVGEVYSLGPVVPPSGYTYPNAWPAYPIPTGWVDSPNEVTRSASPTVPHPGVVFGGLHLYESTGRTPDGWSGAWPSGAPGSHAPTITEGARMYDDNDESGNCIHIWDGSDQAANVLTDDDMEAVGVAAWPAVGAPTVRTKVFSPVYEGTQSLHVQDAGAGVGVYQDFPATTDEGFQAAVRGRFYVASGMVVVRIRDQDGSTIVAEAHHSSPASSWVEVTAHVWAVGAPTTPLRLEILTGPAGADFYVDVMRGYVKNVPWDQWGYDRGVMGRTGGFTFGGDPDEKVVFDMYMSVP